MVYHIEEITKKTGSFKSFNVFVSMLDMLLTQGDSSELQLSFPTYEELQAARFAKSKHSLENSFGNSKNIDSISTNTQFVDSSQKRCLIVTYCTHFDRVQYPLSLNYMGYLDISKLYTQVNELRSYIFLNKPLKETEDQQKMCERLFSQYEEMKNENRELKNHLERAQILLQQAQQDTSRKEDFLDSDTELKLNLDENNNVHDGRPVNLESIQRELLLMQKREKSLLAQISDLSRTVKNQKSSAANLPPMRGRTRNASGDYNEKRAYRANSASLPRRGLYSDDERKRSSGRSSPKMAQQNHSSMNKLVRLTFVSASRSAKFDPTAYVRDQAKKRESIERRRAEVVKQRLRNLSPKYDRIRSRSLSRDSEVSRPWRVRRAPSVFSSSDELEERLRGKQRPTKERKPKDAVVVNDDLLKHKMSRFFASQGPESPKHKTAANTRTNLEDDIDRRLAYLQNFLKKYLPE
ncbi:Coiled-coil domain-containing protein 61 [Cichlidogyrus casuarinus]|uniref:Coiled-coil domain-containing protein 61 n=1 Tax=Cichlidogyrus casuarinus TaxID=1844966 RepID=A0ABD2Q0S8_9PLAT